MTRAEQTEALWQWILDQWSDGNWWGDIDGINLGDEAERLGLLRKEKYDPAVHDEHDMDPGDDIYLPVKP